MNETFFTPGCTQRCTCRGPETLWCESGGCPPGLVCALAQLAWGCYIRELDAWVLLGEGWGHGAQTPGFAGRGVGWRGEQRGLVAQMPGVLGLGAPRWVPHYLPPQPGHA